MMRDVSCPECNTLNRFRDEDIQQGDDGSRYVICRGCNKTLRWSGKQPQSEQVSGQPSGKSTEGRVGGVDRNQRAPLESPRKVRTETPAQAPRGTGSKSDQAKQSSVPDWLKATIGRLEQTIGDLKNEINYLRAEVRDVPRKLDETQQSIQTHGGAIGALERKLHEKLEEVGRRYDGVKKMFEQLDVNHTALVVSVKNQKTSIDETKQVVSQLLQKTDSVAKEATAAQQAALDALQASVEEQEQAIADLTTQYRSWLKCLGSMGTELLDQFKPDFQHHREQMEATRDGLIRAQAKVEDEFRSEFQTLREAHKSVQEFLDEFRSPAGILRMFRAYQTAVAEDLDRHARVALLERLPELLGAVEKELAFWQLKKDGDGNEPLVLSRDGRMLAPKQSEEPQADMASPEEVKLVIAVMVQELKTIQERIKTKLRDCGLECFPNEGDSFDESLHRAVKFVKTDQREIDGQVKRVHYSGLRWAENGKKIIDASVDVWKYDKS
jgi:cell division protein FtsB